MCATTSNIEHWSRDNFQQHVLDPIVTAVKYLASRHVDYIIHTGMPVVTTRGKGFEEELVKQITDVTGLPATTSIRSAIRALAHLGVRNVAVVTPYPQELHQSALTFLAGERLPAWSPSTPRTWCSNSCRTSLRRISPPSPSACWPRRRGRGRLYPMQPVVGGRCRAADRKGMRRAGRHRRARRLLGGVPLARHRRPHRRSWPADGEPEQRRERSGRGAGVVL